MPSGNDPLPKKVYTKFYVTASHHHGLIGVKLVSTQTMI